MRLRFLLPLCAVFVIIPLAFFLQNRPSESPGEFFGIENWRPNKQDIAVQVGRGAVGTYTDDRHMQFARMFQQRYRDNQQAIGLKFVDENTIKLMCAALVPRWRMAQIALQAYQEARELFGKEYNVDIYETYISAKPRKLGELRKIPGQERLRVVFDRRFSPPLGDEPILH